MLILCLSYFITYLQAEVYVNLLEGDSVDEDSLIQKNTGEESWSTINSEDSKNLQELQNLEFLDNSGGTGNNIEESDEVSSVSTLVRILCLKFSLNPLRFSLMRETDTKMTTTEKLSKVINNCKNNHLALSNLAKLVFCQFYHSRIEVFQIA